MIGAFMSVLPPTEKFTLRPSLFATKQETKVKWFRAYTAEWNQEKSSRAPVCWKDLRKQLQQQRFVLTEAEQEVLHRLQYWKDRRVDSRMLAEAFGYELNENRYVTCELDAGGFNNIRMGFEHAFMTAVVTGRVLVVPPALKWYLLDWGPMGDTMDGHGQGRMRKFEFPKTTSHVSDFWDWKSMSEVVPVITTEDFIRRERHRLKIPSHIDESNMQVVPNADPTRWNEWLRQKSYIVDWVPPRFLVWSHTNLTNPEPDHLEKELSQLEGRLRVDYKDKARKATILHLTGGQGGTDRFLGQIASFVAVSTRAQRQMYNAAMRDGLHFVPVVFEIASKVISRLGLFRYSSLHIRRNDLQYHDKKINASNTMNNIGTMLLTGEPLYLATDELDEGFFDAIRQKHPVYKWADFFAERGGQVLKDLHVPRKLIGMIEQLICAGGRTFFGTGLSTFTGLVPRLRGYIGAPDTRLRYHTNKYVVVETRSVVDESNASHPTFVVRESRQGQATPHPHNYFIEWERLWKELPPKEAQQQGP